MIDQLVWIIGVPVIIALVIVVIRRAVALKAAIREHFEEEASGVIKDPYAQMAAAASVQQALDETKERSRQAKQLLSIRRKRPDGK